MDIFLLEIQTEKCLHLHLDFCLDVILCPDEKWIIKKLVYDIAPLYHIIHFSDNTFLHVSV